jgi:hypothetical protein
MGPASFPLTLAYLLASAILADSRVTGIRNSACDASAFSINLTGIECKGMTPIPNATTLEECRLACCAAFPCTVYEVIGGSRCWISDNCDDNQTSAGWVGAAAPPRQPWPTGNQCFPPPTPWSSLPFCNTSLGVDARVSDLVSRMALWEKIGQLGGPPYTAAPSVGLHPFQWWNEATHGTSCNGFNTTNFALPITTGASFNESLWAATSAHIGREARACLNAGAGWETFWTPVLNLVRDVRWGRVLEVPSEDPVQTSVYAAAFVRGIQTAPEAPGLLQVSSTCKHFWANSLENSPNPFNASAPNVTRTTINEAVNPQDAADSYLPGFQACVEDGGASGMMCSVGSGWGSLVYAEERPLFAGLLCASLTVSLLRSTMP